MSETITWSGTVTATSSIAHGGETRGTITMLRRELIVQPSGEAVPVPVISGNAFRGVLRRTGELLLRDALGYEGQLPLAAAHALRSGGSLAKVAGEPLSGARLQRIRELVPQVGVFGCAAAGRIIDGCLQVGKLMPHVAECAHLIPGASPAQPAAGATQLESFTRHDDSACHDFTALGPADSAAADPDSTLTMLYRVETFPAGTRFATWLRLERATPLEVAFFTSVLAAFCAGGRVGGRAGTGHGLITADLTVSPAGTGEGGLDWRTQLAGSRADALEALAWLT